MLSDADISYDKTEEDLEEASYLRSGQSKPWFYLRFKTIME